VIVDYSFYLLNGETAKLSPPKSMQFGKANKRLVDMLARANPHYGPLHLYKVDISDGFYRIQLLTSGVLKLGVCLLRFAVRPSGVSVGPAYGLDRIPTVLLLLHQNCL
jgi:hypothetical protein